MALSFLDLVVAAVVGPVGLCVCVCVCMCVCVCVCVHGGAFH